MAFTDLQTILTVLVLLTAAAVMVYLDCRKKQRARQRERAKARDAAGPHRAFALFDTAQIEYATASKTVGERPLEPRVATPTVSKAPPVTQPAERDTVTVQMNSQSPGPLPAFTIDAALWERLVTGMPRNSLLTSGEEKPAQSIAVAPGALATTYQVIQSDPRSSAWPTAMIQQPAFQELLDSGEPFSGLVVSIGVNESDSSMWHSLGLMQSVSGCVVGLLREKDFACRTDYDEFILACPGEHGAQSQRRLNHISERLWDYQLRGIGTCSILFSWGGVEVHDQPLAEAVESAVDRMRQTKTPHRRTGSPSGSGSAHRKAV